MPETYSLLEFVEQLASDDDLRADFSADPQGVLADHGLAGFAAEDVRDALLLVEDNRTVEYQPDHDVEAGPSFEPAAGPDAAAQYFAHYAGLSAPTAFEVDGSGDIDDLDGYAAAAPQHAALLDEGVPHAAADFGHGVGREQAAPEPDPDMDLPHHEAAAHAVTDPAADPAFDEPGSYDEFGTADAFDHPHAYDQPGDEPDHPH